MEPKELPNGNILVPARAEGPDGLIGDGIHEISPDDPAFQVLVRLVAEPPRDRGAGSLRRTTARLTMASTATRLIGPYFAVLAIRIQGANTYGAGCLITACQYDEDRGFSGRAWRDGWRAAAKAAGVKLPHEIPADDHLR